MNRTPHSDPENLKPLLTSFTLTSVGFQFSMSDEAYGVFINYVRNKKTENSKVINLKSQDFLVTVKAVDMCCEPHFPM
ncbi:hypothetical protein STEG23_014265, partial [Scotinomys teguina]